MLAFGMDGMLAQRLDVRPPRPNLGLARPDVALEVRRPQVIWVVRCRRHHPGVGVGPAPAALLDQPAPGQEVARCARGRDRHRRMPVFQPTTRPRLHAACG